MYVKKYLMDKKTIYEVDLSNSNLKNGYCWIIYKAKGEIKDLEIKDLDQLVNIKG